MQIKTRRTPHLIFNTYLFVPFIYNQLTKIELTVNLLAINNVEFVRNFSVHIANLKLVKETTHKLELLSSKTFPLPHSTVWSCTGAHLFDIELYKGETLEITYFKVKPLVVVLTVDVRIQDQIILIIAHLKKERSVTDVLETVQFESTTTLGSIPTALSRRSSLGGAQARFLKQQLET